MRRPALLLVLLLLAVAGCGGDDGDDGAGATEATETAAPAVTGADGCTDVEAPAPRPDGGATAPTEQLEAGASYSLTFRTNCGSFTVALDRETAPNTVRSLVALAQDGFFDGTVFHRIVPGFVIQGGDPTGTGTGGPGYQTVDVPPATTAYTKGVVAMAKTATEQPGTAGSQFFVVTGEDAQLPPEYAVVGEVSEGLEVVERIGELGDEAQQPTRTVLIEDVTVSTSR